MRLILDTDVVVAAMRSPRGASAALLRAIDDGRGSLLISVALALEYDAVCRRPEHQLAAGLTANQIETFINGIILLAAPVDIHFRWRPQLHDAGDEMVLETAVNGGAERIVTFNRRDYGDAPATFGIELLLPGDALRRMTK